MHTSFLNFSLTCFASSLTAELLNVSMPVLLCWFLLAEYFFYGTGHQASFPTIHWHAAFVGTGGHFYGNFVSTILIGRDTDNLSFSCLPPPPHSPQLKFLSKCKTDQKCVAGFNTFGSHIILGATLPLLVIVPFALHRLFPKFLKAKFFDDIKRGELLLFEQDSAFHAAIFSVAGKYTLLHGIRVWHLV